MTLKTSLIITGDASVAQKAVEDLAQSVANLGGKATAAAEPVAKLDDAANAAGESAAALGDHVDKASASASNLADAAGTAASAVDTIAPAATTSADAVAKLGTDSEAAAATTRGLAETLSGTLAPVVAQTTGAASDLSTMLSGTLASGLDTTGGRLDALSGTATGAGGAMGTVEAAVRTAADAIATFGAGSAEALTAGDQLGEILSGALAGGAELAGTAADGLASTLSGAIAPAVETAEEGLGGMVEGLLGAATGSDDAGDSSGKLAGILSGALAGGIGLAITFLGSLVTEFLLAESAADQARAASEAFAATQSDIGDEVDLLTGRLIKQNSVLRENAILKREEGISASIRRINDIRGEIVGKLQKRAIRSTQASPGSTLTGVGFESDPDIQAQLRAGGGIRDYDRRLGELIKRRSDLRGLRIAVSELAAESEKLYAGGKKAQAEIPVYRGEPGALAAYNAAYGKPEKPARTPTARGTRAGGASSGRSDRADAPSRASGGTRATSDEASALRDLQQSLDGVIGRYDPARKAAADFAAELEKIDALARAYDPSKGVGLAPDDAQKYRDAATAANTARQRELALTPEAKAAAEAGKSIDDLVASLRGELAVRKELDPVEAEMLKHKADLAKLAPDARKAKEAEIRGLYAEIDATEAVADAAREAEQAKRQLQNAALGALDAIIIGGEKAGDVIKRLAGSIASAALEATIFGTGPMATLLKGGLSGGTRSAGGGVVQGAANAALTDGVGKAVGSRMDRIFGTQGSFAKTLQGAGIGFAAGGMTGSSAGGAVGGALGGKFIGDALGKMLPKALGSLAGPLGSLAGGLLGGALGGLLAGKKYGTAAITSNSAAASVSGSGSAQSSAASGLAGAVQQGIAQIAERLGGQLGNYAVSIGTYKDQYRVSKSGYGGKLKGGNLDVVDFGKDGEAAAIAYAIQDAIKDGAVSGLSAAVQQAIRSSSDVNVALKEALKVQEVETLMGGLGGSIDKAFRDFEATAKERVRIASQYGFDIVAIEKRNADDRAKIAEDLLKGQIGSLKQLVDEMTRGSLFEGSSLERLGKLDEAIVAARADMDAGIEGAGDTLASLLEQKVGALKDSYGTTGGYADGRAAILDEARAAIAKANAKIVEAQAKVTPSSDPALRATNAALDENNEQNAQMLAALETSNRLLMQMSGGSAFAFDVSALARV